MTTGSRPAAFRVPVTFKGKTGLILLDQIRTLDKVPAGPPRRRGDGRHVEAYAGGSAGDVCAV